MIHNGFCKVIYPVKRQILIIVCFTSLQPRTRRIATAIIGYPLGKHDIGFGLVTLNLKLFFPGTVFTNYCVYLSNGNICYLSDFASCFPFFLYF